MPLHLRRKLRCFIGRQKVGLEPKPSGQRTFAKVGANVTNQLRAILPLLKARVIDRSEAHFTIGFGSEYGSPTTIRISCDTKHYDLRDGDLLTLYTEVLLANPSQSPI